MIRVVITARVKSGGMPDAIVAGKAIAEHVGRKHGVQVAVLQRHFGPLGIAWVAEYSDVAAAERLQGQLMTDQAYWAHVKKVSDALVEDSVEVALWQAI